MWSFAHCLCLSGMSNRPVHRKISNLHCDSVQVKVVCKDNYVGASNVKILTYDKNNKWECLKSTLMYVLGIGTLHDGLRDPGRVKKCKDKYVHFKYPGNSGPFKACVL